MTKRMAAALMVMALLMPMKLLEAGQGGTKTKTNVLTMQTRAVGTYTFPANFASGVSIPTGVFALGLDLDRTQLTNPVTRVQFVTEVSFDNGVTWCPEWATTGSCPGNATSSGAIAVGGVVVMRGETQTTSSFEFPLPQTQNTNRRGRGTIIVSGASATFAMDVTWLQ